MRQAAPSGTLRPDAAAAARPPRQAIREVSSRELLGDADELLIRHRDALYRLRLTKQDKLILTK